MTDDTKLILGRIDEMEERLTARMGQLESRMDDMKSRMDGTESDISALQLTLENVTNRNIEIIAENHLDLSRKLDEALKVEAVTEIEKLEKVVFA